MNIKAEHISELIIRFIHGELSANEAAEFETWRQADPAHKALIEELTNENTIAALLKQRYAYDNSRVSARLRGAFPGAQFNNTAEKKPVVFPIVHRVHFLKTAWFRYAAAIIILFGIAAYFWNNQQKGESLIATTKLPPGKNDIIPGSDKAVLTLSNGQQIQLDSAAPGTIKDGSLAIENKNGGLSYSKADVVAINTMTTPKGGEYKLTLADGTRVWLNAASSITYPTAFNENNRTVSVTGEVYFDIAKRKGQPFIVNIDGGSKVEVLGTQFNINAYDNEEEVRATLIEGSIKVAASSGGNNVPVILYPGQQGRINRLNKSEVIVRNNVAIDEAIAWQSGMFVFDNADIYTITRQLNRWYNIEIQVEGDMSKMKFGGSIAKKSPLSRILDVLKANGAGYKWLNDKLIFYAL